MARFIELTEIGGNKTYVNAESITQVSVWHDTNTFIEFVSGSAVRVKESYEEIKEKLFDPLQYMRR